MRLIDADRLKEQWTIASPEPYTTDAAEVIDSIKDAPTVDAVTVVRCKDCKHLRADVADGPVCWHTYGLRQIFFNSYCAYGEYQTNTKGDNP